MAAHECYQNAGSEIKVMLYFFALTGDDSTVILLDAPGPLAARRVRALSKRQSLVVVVVQNSVSLCVSAHVVSQITLRRHRANSHLSPTDRCFTS